MKNILLLPFLMMCSLGFGQVHTMDTLLNAGQANFRIINSIEEDKEILHIYRDSSLIFSDTMGYEKSVRGNNIIVDFNGDGYLDIKKRRGSIYSFEVLYLYHKALNNYIKIIISGSAKFLKPNVFYNYYSVGCANSEWVSKLYVINNHGEFVNKYLLKGYMCDKPFWRVELVFEDLILEVAGDITKYRENKTLAIKEFWEKIIINY